MPEVFSISGANYFGQTTPCPVGWKTTSKGNCQGPLASQLQQAIRTLGVKVGDSRLIISIDGTIGPETATAANIALTQYIKLPDVPAPGPSPSWYEAKPGQPGYGMTPLAPKPAQQMVPQQIAAYLRTGKLSVAQVANDAGIITSVITAEVQRRGGQVAPVPPAPVPGPVPVPVPGPVPVPPVPGPVPSEGISMGAWLVLGLGVLAVGAGIFVMMRSRGRTAVAEEALTV